MANTIVPFITLNGKVEEAMNYYVNSFPNSKITESVSYGDLAQVDSEKKYILHGEAEIMGTTMMFMDMVTNPGGAAPAVSWSTSFYLDCATEAEFDAIFASLSNGGTVMMGPEAAGDLRKVAWVTDKFGVTWQPVWK